MSRVHLAEVFGPTWQGEGPHAGRRCGFVRLGLCNLSCEWCDTAYTWDRSRYDLDKEAPLVGVADVLAQMERIDTSLWILSGGEPLIHHHTLPDLMSPGYEWHVETNGTIPPPSWWVRRVDHTTVSPKINTRDPEHRRLRHDSLTAWAALAHAGRACFKFVAREPADLDAIQEVVDNHAIDCSTVWVMPEGTRPASLLRTHRTLADGIGQRGWNTTTRLHVLLYDDERGH